MRRELEALEILRRNQHPNLTVYHGYIERRGRVAGLCLKLYAATLYERVDPGHLSKWDFRASGRVPNNITPANIMFDEDGTAVIVDFASCRRVGESLVRQRLGERRSGSTRVLRLRWKGMTLMLLGRSRRGWLGLRRSFSLSDQSRSKNGC